LPDRVNYERFGLSPDTIAILRSLGHSLNEIQSQGAVEAILYDSKHDVLEGGFDRRTPHGAAAGW